MIINVPFSKLNKVCHVSDIHIRLFKRHDEYKTAFSQLYSDIRQALKGVDGGAIVVAGDVLHAKTDMSPEMVELASQFLSSLANITTTLVVAGNHDLNLSNMNRLDSLTPLINNINHKQLHYLKHSGVYQVADVDFAVMSILDEREDWPTTLECRKGARKVALFHGPVHGATTDAKFVITNRHVDVGTFSGFDIVMLGDIHKYQVLQERNEKKHKPVIVYSSSLIQQNHGESLKTHGWCLWDMKDCTHEFMELKNSYGFYTLEIINNKVTLPAYIPKNSRVRLFTGAADASVVKKTIASLRKKHNIIELSVNKNAFNSKATGVGSTSNIVDVTNVGNQNSLIQDWLGRVHNVKDVGILKKVIDINTRLNTQINHEDHSRNISWKPTKFTFSNMFSYGDGNVIDFEDMNGIYGIFAANASGKSSSMDALMFCLYDKTPRAFRGDHIMNNRKDKFECELTFEINQETYVIRRTGIRKKTGDVKVDVSFWKEHTDGTHTSLNGEDRRDTNANIRSYVGSYEDFVLTTLSGQTSNALFIDKSHSERKDLLIQFMGLNIFDALYGVANDEVKEITGALKKFKNTDFTQELANTQKELESTISRRNVLLEKLEANKEKLVTFESDKSELLLSKRPAPNIQLKESKLQEYLQSYRKQESECATELGDFLSRITPCIDELDKLRVSLSRINKSELEAGYEKDAELKYDIEKLDGEISRAEHSLLSHKKMMEKLSVYKYNPDCSICVTNNETIIKELSSTQALLTEETVHLGVLKDRRSSLINQKHQLAGMVDQFSEMLSLEGIVDKLESEKDRLTNAIQNSNTKLELVRKYIDEYTNQLNEHVVNRENIIFNKQLDETLESIDIDIINVKNSTGFSEKASIDLFGQIKVLEKTKQDYVNYIKEAEELEDTYEAYEYYMLAISRDGIPYEMMSKAIPNIESEINDILSQIVEFTISLEVDGKNIVGRLNYDHERIWPLENSSGMERFISSLAIRVALLNASNLPKPNFMIIDEGLGTLDAENLSSMGVLFGILKNQFDFLMIISHLDTARDMVDHVIEIRKEDGFSFISV